MAKSGGQPGHHPPQPLASRWAAWQQLSAVDRDEVMRKHQALRAELTASGELLNGAGLADPVDTTTVQWQPGGAASRNGPFVRADDPMTAYYVINCADLERALALAERLLDVHVTAVEVRHIHDTVGM